MSENIARWLRLARTRRMFARALGGGERPNETYLAIATTALDAVATEWARVPWAEAEALPSVERLARALIHDDVDDSTFHARPRPDNIAAFVPRARRILRWLADDDYRPTDDEWDDDRAALAPTELEAEQ